MKKLRQSIRQRFLLASIALGGVLVVFALSASAVVTPIGINVIDPVGENATLDFPFSNGFDTTLVSVVTDPTNDLIFVQWTVNTIAGNADPASTVTPCAGNPTNTCSGDASPSTSPNSPNLPNESGPETYIITILQAATPGPSGIPAAKITAQVRSDILCPTANTSFLLPASPPVGMFFVPSCVDFAASPSHIFAFSIRGVSLAGFSFDNEFSIKVSGSSNSLTDGPGEDTFLSPTIPGTTTTTTTTTIPTTLPPPTIPTTGEWGMMIFGAALLGFMAWMIQARRSIK